MKYHKILVILIMLSLSASSAFSQNIDYLGSALWSGICDVKIQGNYAYCAFFNGLMILDIAVPDSPTFVSQLYIGGTWNDYGSRQGQKFCLKDNYIFYAADYLGLKIIDISDPEYPIIAGEYLTPTYASGIFAVGNYAYITCPPGQQGQPPSLQIVNITVPSNPTFVGSLNLVGDGEDVVVVGNYAYLADGWFEIIDVSNPASPTRVGTYDAGPSYAVDVQVVGNYAYVAYGYLGLVILNITDPTNPTFVGSWSSPNAWVDGVIVNGGYAYVETDIGLGIFDISDPANPFQVGGLAGGWALEAFISGSYAYVAALTNGLQVVNISSPSNPTLAGTYPAPEAVLDVYIQDHYAYLATGQTGLKIVDITNPLNMPLVGSWVGTDFFDRPSSCFVSGIYAYLGTNGKFKIINISNPASPIAVGSYDFADAPKDVFVVEPYAYIATGTNYGAGFYVLDISSPANPTVVGTYNLPNVGWNLQIIENYAYVACGWFYILDISNPADPIFIGRYHDIEGGTGGVCVSGEYAYLANASTFDIVNISDRAHPVMTGSYPIAMGTATTVNVRGNYVLVGESRGGDWSQQGLEIFDVTDKSDPVLVDNFKTPGDIYSVIDRGDNQIFLADEYSLMALQFDMTGITGVNPTPVSISLSQNYPNPFNAQTTISYALQETGPVNLSVYNILGQKVATFFDGIQVPGKHQVIWDAGTISSGIYFTVLKTSDQSKKIKMVLLK